MGACWACEGRGCTTIFVKQPQVPEPEFEGQTKTRLGNPEVRRIVDACVARVRCSPI